MALHLEPRVSFLLPRGKNMSAVGVVKNRAPHSLGPDAFLRFGARITSLPNSKKYTFFHAICAKSPKFRQLRLDGGFCIEKNRIF